MSTNCLSNFGLNSAFYMRLSLAGSASASCKLQNYTSTSALHKHFEQHRYIKLITVTQNSYLNIPVPPTTAGATQKFREEYVTLSLYHHITYCDHAKILHMAANVAPIGDKH